MRRGARNGSRPLLRAARPQSGRRRPADAGRRVADGRRPGADGRPLGPRREGRAGYEVRRSHAPRDRAPSSGWRKWPKMVGTVSRDHRRARRGRCRQVKSRRRVGPRRRARGSTSRCSAAPYERTPHRAPRARGGLPGHRRDGDDGRPPVAARHLAETAVRRPPGCGFTTNRNLPNAPHTPHGARMGGVNAVGSGRAREPPSTPSRRSSLQRSGSVAWTEPARAGRELPGWSAYDLVVRLGQRVAPGRPPSWRPAGPPSSRTTSRARGRTRHQLLVRRQGRREGPATRCSATLAGDPLSKLTVQQGRHRLAAARCTRTTGPPVNSRAAASPRSPPRSRWTACDEV